jgi:hypothetical protein
VRRGSLDAGIEGFVNGRNHATTLISGSSDVPLLHTHCLAWFSDAMTCQGINNVADPFHGFCGQAWHVK